MGGETSKPESKRVEEERIEHPHFLHAEIVDVDQKGDQLIKMRVPVHGEKTIKDWETGLNEIRAFDRESLLLPAYHSFESQGFCGTSGMLNIFYPYYPYLLSIEIENRREGEEEKSFSETELWYLLYTICSQAAQFHKEGQGSKLGDIRPLNIFINQGGYIKLANIWSWPNAENNYEASLLNNTTTYLAPEQLEELQYGKNYPQTNSQKSQSFSIGLTLLDCIFLQDSSKYYDFKKYYFFADNLKKTLQNLQKQPFSEYFKRIVSQLCEVDAKKRITAIEVCKELLPYEKKIMKLDEFEKPGGYSYGSYLPSSYPTPEGSSYMYSSEVTKGFNDKIIASQNYQAPPLVPPGYNYTSSTQKEPRFPIPSHNRQSTNSYKSPILNTSNNQTLTGAQESPLKTYQPQDPPKYISQQPSTTHQQKYEINESYDPNQVSRNYQGNYAGYGSSHIPSSEKREVVGQLPSLVDPNSYKIPQPQPHLQQPSLSTPFKYTTSTYLNRNQIHSSPPSQNTSVPAPRPLILPSGSESITYEIESSHPPPNITEQANRTPQHLQNGKYVTKQFPTLKQLDQEITTSIQERRLA